MTEERKLAAAMLRARLKLPPIAKTARNPHFGNMYAPLGEILATVIPVYGAEDVLLTAGIMERELWVCAVHTETGEERRSCVPLPDADPQKLKAAHTYAFRTGLEGLCALELDADDDGNRASAGKATPAAVPASRAQGSARPVSSVTTWDKAPQRAAQGHDDQDAGVVQAIAEAMDAKAAADGKPYRTIKGGKYAITGKNADYLGLKSGAYSAAELAAMGKLSKYRERLEFFAEKDRLQYTVPIFDETPPPAQSQFADAKEADAVVDLTGDDSEMPF